MRENPSQARNNQETAARRHAEAQLRFQAQLLDSVREVVVAIDLERKVTYWGKGAASVFGYEAAEIVGTSIDKVADPKLLQSDIPATLLETGSWQGHYEGRRRNGNLISLDMAISPVRGQNEEVLGYVGIGRDTTQERKLADTLQRERDFARNLIDTAQVIVLTLDVKGRILHFNPYMETLSGYRLGEVYGQEWFTTFLPQRVQAEVRQIFTDITSGQLQQKAVGLIVTRDGRELEIEWHNAILTDKENQIVGVLATGQDITERRRRERAQALIKDIANQITAVLDPDHLMRSVVELLHKTFNYHHIALFTLLDERAVLRAIAGEYTDYFEANHTQSLNEGIIGWVATSGEKRLVNDVSQDPLYISLIPEHTKTRAELCLPFKMADNIIGVLDVQSPQRHAFNETDVFALETLVDEVAIALENARLYSSLRQELQERKQAEKRLRQLSVAVEQSPASIVITDTDGNIEYVNPKFTTLTGYTLPEVLGENPRILKSGKTSAAEYELLWETIVSGGEWHGEFCNKKKNGEVYWEIASISPIFDDRQITHFLAVKEDITAYKQMEEALRQRNRELNFLNQASHALNSTLDLEKVLRTLIDETKRLLGVVACSVWFVEKDGTLVCRQVTNPHADIILGWRLQPGQGVVGWVAAQGKSLIVPDVTRDERHYDGVDQQTGLSIRSLLTTPLHVKGRVIGVFQAVDERPYRFTHHDRQLAESLATIAANAIENARLHKDLQKQLVAREKAQARLVQNEKLAAIGELVAGVAHELNNPLTSTILYAQLLQAKAVPDEFRKDLDQIVSQSRRASRIVRGLLDFARQSPPERQETMIHDIIQSTIELLAYELRTNNVEIRTLFTDNLPTTMADRQQLQQVFVNLMHNALQAIRSHRKQGKIIISTEAGPSVYLQETNHADVIRITFTDDGPGIPPENLSRIFDPFFTTKEEGQGTGLGLAICHGIIREHQGHIWVESTLGRGTVFFIELPIDQPGSVKTNGRSMSGQLTDSTQKHRILIIDDEESVVTVLTQILRRAGYAVDGAPNGKEGVALLAERAYELILCDLRMPGLGGIEFYEIVLESYPEMGPRIVFMTGDTVNAHTRLFLENHQVEHLGKPFERHELLSIVEQKIRQGKIKSRNRQ